MSQYDKIAVGFACFMAFLMSLAFYEAGKERGSINPEKLQVHEHQMKDDVTCYALHADNQVLHFTCVQVFGENDE